MTERGEIIEEDKQGHLFWVKPALEKLLGRDKELILNEAEKIRHKYRKGLTARYSSNPSAFDNACLELAIRWYIMQHKTIDPKKEIEIQVWEAGIEKHCQQVQAGREVSFDDVMMGWAKEHAEGWRSHNILRGLYVFEKEQDYFMSIVRPPQQNTTQQTAG